MAEWPQFPVTFFIPFMPFYQVEMFDVSYLVVNDGYPSENANDTQSTPVIT
jgi:hypothetical protein